MINDNALIIKKTQRMRTIKKYLFIGSILIIPFISFCFFYLYVNASSFLLAFQNIDIKGKYTFVGFQNFIDFFNGFASDSQAKISLLNSLKMWWINFCITMPLYLIFSYYVFKKFAGHKLFRIIVMLPSIVSGFVYALLYKKFVDVAFVDIMASWGFKNFPNLITDSRYAYGNNIFFTIWLSFGTSILIYTNAMNGVGDEIIESAHLDGVNDRQEFFKIVLPIVWPTLSTMVVTGVTSMFTVSGSLMAFYMTSAPPNIWGFDYYITVTVKNNASTMAYMEYPAVATAGMVVTLVTVPIVYTVKYLMNKFDKTEDFT